MGERRGQEHVLLLPRPRLPASSREPNPAPTNGETESQRTERACQGYPVSWQQPGAPASTLPPGPPGRALRGASNRFVSRSLGNFSCHRQAQPEPGFHAHPSPLSHPKLSGARRRGRGRAPGAQQGRPPSPRGSPLPVRMRRRGAGRRAPGQGHPRRRGGPGRRTPDPRPRAPRPRRQPEAAAIYRGSHAQSLLAAAATAEYFAQIWLGPRRGGREPRGREEDPCPGGGLTGL